MRNKKAIGAIFAWIFILVAGALIITLFILLAQGQATSAKETLSQRAFQNINTIITTQQTAGGVETTVPIPQSEIRLSCRAFMQGGEVALLNQLDISGYAQPLDRQLITGRDMSANALSVFSKKWKAPFDAGNILYVSNPEELLIYDLGPGFTQNFSALFPDNINVNKNTVNPSDISNRQNVRVVHISTAAPIENSKTAGYPEAFTKYQNENTLLIYVQPKEIGTQKDITAQGTVTYYQYNEQSMRYEKTTSFEYVGEAMLLGYIWQGDVGRAACLQHKLAQTLTAQADIHIERIRILDFLYGQNTVCAAKLDSSALTELKGSLGEPDEDLLNDEQKLYDFSNLYERITELEQINTNLLRGDSCATIY